MTQVESELESPAAEGALEEIRSGTTEEPAGADEVEASAAPDVMQSEDEPAEIAGSAGSPEPASSDDRALFLADLARAMQTTAGAERIRVGEETDRRRQVHLEGVRAREADDASALREVAEVDSQGIDAWADTEIQRIQDERERRILARRRDLEASLDDHRVLVEREVAAVEDAISAYRAEITTYFDGLEGEADPVAIARLAGTRPAFPNLESIGPDDAAVRAAANAAEFESAERTSAELASAEFASSDGQYATPDFAPEAIGVMDEEAATGQRSGLAELGEIPVETSGPGGVIARSSAALLRAVPALRPMGSTEPTDDEVERSS
jgi:hypothetical protein